MGCFWVGRKVSWSVDRDAVCGFWVGRIGFEDFGSVAMDLWAGFGSDERLD